MRSEFNLDVIGVIEGTNKSSSVGASMDYLRHYARLFQIFREEPINLIEIGVGGGASLAVWKSFFTRARIVGIDIHPNRAGYADDRVTIEIGSQEDPDFLTHVCKKYPPTIIVDDGSHFNDHILCAFEHMFPLLIPGGLYIVEDLAIHFGLDAERFKGVKEWSSDYFLRIARSCLARSIQGEPNEIARYTLKTVDSIEFIDSALAIHKVAAARDVSSALDFADEYLRDRKPDADAHERLAQFIVRHRGSLDRAEAELKRAIEIGGETPQRLIIFSEICWRQGRLSEAAAMAERGANLGAEAHFWIQAGDMRGHLGDHAAAALAYQQAMSMQPGNSALSAMLSEALERQGKLVEALAAARQGLGVATGTAQKELRGRVDRLHAEVGS